jgi:DNA replication ATP-dependent helicase Dna2
MDISLFKRLSECHPHAVVHLEYQYRMHKHIMLLSNALIYENRLKCATREISETLLDLPDLDTLRADITRLEKQQQGRRVRERESHEHAHIFTEIQYS